MQTFMLDLIADIKTSAIPTSYKEFRILTDGQKAVQLLNKQYLLKYNGMNDWIIIIQLTNVLRPTIFAVLICPALEEIKSIKINLDFLEPEYSWNTAAKEELIARIKGVLED